MILVCGGSGFIGSNFILEWLCAPGSEAVVNLDKLNYAGNRHVLHSLESQSCYNFIHGDIASYKTVGEILSGFRPRAVINFAAETHVDRSIYSPSVFVENNTLGTACLLESVYQYWKLLPPTEKEQFRFVQVSTDEVYGSLEADEKPFTEEHAFRPNNPYSASKASADHLTRVYYCTYELPTIGVHCVNNYGPYQFPEKLIPFMIYRALASETLPVYGDGMNVRDWIYVGDHCAALRQVLALGRPGERYNIGASCEKTNIEVVNTLCTLLDEMKTKPDGTSYASQICFVKDRPGHDRRYAIDSTKACTELSWRPVETFYTGIRKTLEWYLCHQGYYKQTYDHYHSWVSRHYT